MTAHLDRGFAALLLSMTLLPAAAHGPKLVGGAGQAAQGAGGRSRPRSKPSSSIRSPPWPASWTGGGTIALTGDINERLRCRANHTYGAANSSLALNIRCASDNYKIELVSNVTERRGQISGQWRRRTTTCTGTIAGRVSGNRVDGARGRRQADART